MQITGKRLGDDEKAFKGGKDIAFITIIDDLRPQF